MFTGIIEAVGRIVSTIPLQAENAGVRLQVHAETLDHSDIEIGDSIAVSGVCLTVVEKSDVRLSFDVSSETLSCTMRLNVAGSVNLEKALRFGDRLGGHLVAGHVDGVGVVKVFRPEAESHRLEIEAPPELAKYIASKGSVTVDGVSLTTNEVNGARFSVNLIPHTLAVTTLGALQVEQGVNLEVDLVARYLERLLPPPRVSS